MRLAPATGPAVERFFQYSLLGMLASGFLALAASGSLDPLIVVVVIAAFAVRALLVAGVFRFDISGRAVMWMALASVLAAVADYRFISHEFTLSTARLILLLAAIKSVTASTSRDYAYLRIIALLEILAACVFSSNLSFLVFLALFLVFAIAAFASAEIRRSAATRGVVIRAFESGLPPRLGALCATLAGGILVMTCGLFFLLPRTARAALQHLMSGSYHVSGFASEIHLGGIGEVEERKTPVMSITMTDGSRPRDDLKWKGGTLVRFDGHTWFNPPHVSELVPSDRRAFFILAPAELRRRNARIIEYEVHMNGGAGNALFFAGDPEFLWLDTPQILRTAPGSYRVREGSSAGLIYQASSFVPDNGAVVDDDPGQFERTAYLQLPTLDPRIPALAISVADNQPTEVRKAIAIQLWLRRHYRYTLQLPHAAPADPLAAFLFDQRQGHCEYFASAMAVMLRTLGIPSRVATGFQSGIYNPVSGRQIIRASDAHSWVEAWFPDRGWMTFDPTPPAPAGTENWLLARLNMYADAADIFWQDWVLDYNLSHQLSIAVRIQESSRRFRIGGADLFSAELWNAWRARCVNAARRYGAATITVVVLVMASAWFGPALLRTLRMRRQLREIGRGRIVTGDATLLYDRLLRLLHRRGIEKPGWLTPFEFAAMVRDPTLAPLVDDATQAYNRLRFGGDTGEAGHLIELLRQIEHCPRS